MSDMNNNILELLYFESHPEKHDRNKTKKLTEIGCSHFALTVKEIDSLYGTLTQQGIEFVHAPQVSPNGKVKVAFCRDPDGTFIEMVEEL
jgi:extradiol dioxygenase family protein